MLQAQTICSYYFFGLSIKKKESCCVIVGVCHVIFLFLFVILVVSTDHGLSLKIQDFYFFS
jgi:hypothetical protein